jgi:Tol biopolymer transport system component
VRPRVAAALVLALFGVGACDDEQSRGAGAGASVAAPRQSTPRLAFFRTHRTDYQIATADARGRRIRVVAGKSVAGSAIPYLFTRPAWSPNGRRIAFAGVRSGAATAFAGDIYTMRADGSRQRRITNSHDAVDPIWSPDGRTIVFTRMRRGRDGLASGSLWAMRRDGSNQRQLTRRAEGQIDQAGSFARDGAQFAFTRVTCAPPEKGGCLSRRPGLFLMRPDGSGQHLLLDRASDPTFSPDGNRIAFVSDRDENGRLSYGDREFFANELYVMRADGDEQRRLTRTRHLNEAQPSWLPDGTRLAFQRGKQIQNAEAMSLRQINPNGTCERKILADPRLATWYASPAWRPGKARRGGGRLSC